MMSRKHTTKQTQDLSAMKLKYLIPAILLTAIAVDASAQQKGKNKGGSKHKWRVQLLQR